MAKVRRRIKNKKEVGNCGINIKGRGWVNLGTKDYRLANKRAVLARQGRWPLPQVAEDAAEVAAKAEHVPISPTEAELLEKELPGQQAPQGARPEGAAPGLSRPDAAPVVPPAEVDPVAAARAAAADVDNAGILPATGETSEPADIAREMGKELQREFFPEGGEGGDDPGLVGASILFSLEHEVGQRIAARSKPPRSIPEPDKADVLVRVTACACRVLGRHYTGDIAIHPLYVLLAVALVGYPLQMALTARTEEQAKATAAAELASKAATSGN